MCDNISDEIKNERAIYKSDISRSVIRTEPHCHGRSRDLWI